MTTLINRCRACLGKKKLLGLGGMMKDCLACKGIGFMETELEKPKAAPASVPVRKTIVDLTKPKPRGKGRPHAKPTIDLTVQK